MAEKQNGPKGFIVVLPGEIIEIPLDSPKAWLTLFYALPKEFVQKWPKAFDIPRCPYDVLRGKDYDSIMEDGMFQLLVWDSYSWAAWQFFQVKDRSGNYRDIPGDRSNYTGYFPLWQLSYGIVPHFRQLFESHGLGFQNLYTIPKGMEIPWLTYQQFSNLIGNATDKIVAEQNWQPTIDAIWESRCVEDYEEKFSLEKRDFLRKWHHDRSGQSISLEEMMENEDGDIFQVEDPYGEFEQSLISTMQIAGFAEKWLTKENQKILQLRMQGHTEKEIAAAVGFKTASAVHKRLESIAHAYEEFVLNEYQKYLDGDNTST